MANFRPLEVFLVKTSDKRENVLNMTTFSPCTLMADSVGSISAALSCRSSPKVSSGEERGLLSRTAAGNRAYW